MSLSVLKINGVLGAYLRARSGQAALALVGDDHLIVRAGMAGKLDDVDEGRLVVLLRIDRFLGTRGYR